MSLDAENEARFSFQEKLDQHSLRLTRLPTETLQVNITKLCNQACLHCHVDASPRRREMMSDEAISACLSVLKNQPDIKNIDITGGAPELHPKFREFVQAAVQLGKHVIVRHNLTVTLDPHPLTKEAMTYLPEFFAGEKVEVVSSLPYYQEYFTDKQRGSGVFKKSIESLKRLNAKGFGVEGSGLILNLVYNPVGAFLPPDQADLERTYKKELEDRFGITFSRLFALANMPIHRFKVQLKRTSGYEAYMERLSDAFNPEAAKGVMCRSLISVSHDGFLYDCDFNQMLDLKIGENRPMTIFDWNKATLDKTPIEFRAHCLGCTAGAGSSCGGKTT